MASAGLQLLAFVLALSGICGIITATVLPNWKVTAKVGVNIITAITQVQGLWMDCTWYSNGIFSCKIKSSFLAPPVYVQTARATMLLACMFSALGICISTVGMKCTRLGGDRQTKSRTAFAGGVCFILSGVSGLIPTSWYLKNIISDFWNPTIPGNKYEPGGAIYLGLISTVPLFVAGVIFCTSCLKEHQKARHYPPNHPGTLTPQPENNAGYNLKDYV